MANFSGNENLLGFKGAKLFSGLDAQHPKMNWVCIPVDWNDIQVSADGTRANVGVYIQETNEAFRQACITRKQQSGDDMTGYMPPSHQIEVSFSKDFRERALEAARKRLMGEHPEWTGMDNPEENKDLKNAMYDAVRVRLGSIYARVKQQSQMQTAAPAAQNAAAWTPPATDPITGQPINQQSDNDDLPF